MATGTKRTRTERVEKVISEEVQVPDGITLELNDREAEFLMQVVDGLHAGQPEVMALYRALLAAGVRDRGGRLGYVSENGEYVPVPTQVVVLDRNGKTAYYLGT